MYCFSRELPFNNDFDIIVAGGGPSGCTAAAAAAGEGAKVLLLESGGCLGGMATAGLVTSWAPFSDGEKPVYRGLAQTILDRAKSGIRHIPRGMLDWVPIDVEKLKRVYDDILAEYGVSVLFNTSVVGADTDNNGKMMAVIAANKSGLTAYSAKVFVDCTGDADLTAFGGGKFQTDGDKDAEPMPSTLCFTVANVDTYAYLYDPRYGQLTAGGMLLSSNPESFVKYLPDDSRFPNIKDTHMCNDLVGPGVLGFNAGHIFNVDATEPSSVSRALALGRVIAEEYCRAFSLYFPEAFANAFLVETAPSVGIRESRRILGRYTLTLDDYFKRAQFEDEIARNCYYLDKHLTESELELERRGKLQEKQKYENYKKGESHGIPYRCLVPEGLKNVLVAGRTVSCEKTVQSSLRVMPCCLAMGQAAGTAAALAAASGRDAADIDCDRLRSILREKGAYICG